MKSKVETQTTLADYLAVENPKAGFLAKVDELIDWRPIEKLLKKKYLRTEDATGKDSYPNSPCSRRCSCNAGTT